MNSPYLFTLLVVAAMLLGDVSAQAQVFWRVSVKVFTDSSGNRPSDRTDGQIVADYNYYNALLANYARGCQFSLTEIVELPSSLSTWFGVQARNAANRDALLSAANSNAVLFAYRSNQINIYINNSSSGVCCGAANGLIFVGNEDGHITPVHEIGHMLGLSHTQGSGCNSCCPDPLGCCDTPGNDGISDTISDLPCWDQDAIAQNNFGELYANLSAGQRDQVDDVWLNIMSYHYGFFNNLLERLTPGQMDRVAETSNGSRDNVTGNAFFFVDGASGNDLNNGKTAAASLKTVDGAITASSADDVLLMRAGTYTRTVAGSWILNTSRVLCSRNGTVRLTKVNP